MAQRIKHKGDSMNKLTDLIEEHKIRMTATFVSRTVSRDIERPYGGTYVVYQDNWKCRLSCGRRSLTVDFHLGEGHNGRTPDVTEVLACILMDVNGYDNARDFEEWCAEYGYDTDSRQAERDYQTIGKQYEGVQRLLGDDYDSFINSDYDNF